MNEEDQRVMEAFFQLMRGEMNERTTGKRIPYTPKELEFVNIFFTYENLLETEGRVLYMAIQSDLEQELSIRDFRDFFRKFVEKQIEVERNYGFDWFAHVVRSAMLGPFVEIEVHFPLLKMILDENY